MALQQRLENCIKFRQCWAIWTMFMLIRGSSCRNCAFDAIFNFGDSNSDTGAYLAAFPPESEPYRARACDGRLIIDFLAEALGLPSLSPYLQSIGSDYRHGINFATRGSTVNIPSTSVFVSGTSPFALPIQLNQFKLFKSKVDNQINAGGSDKLPPPDVFGRSLYTIYIGQNDFTFFNSTSLPVVDGDFKEFLSGINAQISETIKELYELGGRTFLVFNLAPLGCYPSILVHVSHSGTDLDEFGCIAPYNDAVDDYNLMLKSAMDEAREALSDSSLVYVDTHAVFLDLFRHPTSHGLRYTTRACCGYGGGAYNYDRQVHCGDTMVINGSTVQTTACSDPQHYISWDGLHNTEAANKLVADVVLGGTSTDPRFPLAELCRLRATA